MQTLLQNTEVEESLTQQAENDDNLNTGFNPLEGELIDDDGGETDVSEDVSEETASQSDDADSDVVEQGSDTGDSDGGGDNAGTSDRVDEEGHEADGEEGEEVSALSESLGKLKTPKGRDYSKFSEEDAKYLKQMSNEAFEHFSKLSEKSNKLQEEIEAVKQQAAKEVTTADHPDAYILSDEYKDTYANMSKAQQEQQHWRAQLIKIRNGENWQNIEGYNDAGQLVIGKDAFKPTQQSEIDVEMAMQEAAGLSRKFNSDLDNVSKSYKKNYEDAVTLLDREQKANFAWTTDDAVAKQELVLPNVGSTTIQQIKTTFSNALPKTFQKHPLAELASNLFVTLQLQAAHADSEKAAVKEEVRKEPKAKRKSSVAATESSDEEFSVPDWMNV